MKQISIVMPYWNRKDAVEATILQLFKLYPNLSFEVVVVDDGSDLQLCSEVASKDVTVISLPVKTQALNPCVPINRGVDVAKGKTIVLTNPEIWHSEPILPTLIERLAELGPKGYVAAACQCAERGLWLCRSDVVTLIGRAKLPPNAGLHFCAALSRDLFLSVGGFDERYRNGRGFEDNDFLWKLHSAGVKFAISDDLVVHHLKAPRSIWPKGNANERLFIEKWGSI